MKVFKLFFKLAKKYKFYYLFSIIFMVVFTVPFLEKQTDNITYQHLRLKISVIDHDQSVFSKDLIAYLKQFGEIVPVEDDAQKKSDALFNFKTDVILTVPENWEEAILAKEDLPKIKKQVTSDVEISVFTDNFLYRYIKGLEVKRIGFQSAMDQQKIKEELAALHQSLKTDVQVDINQTGVEQSVQQFGKIYTPYFGYVALMTFIVVIGGVQISTQDPEIVKRDRMSAMTQFQRTSQLWLGSFVWAIIYWAILMVVAGLIFGWDVFRDQRGQLYTLNTLLCIVGIHSIAYFISVLAKNKGVLSFLSITLSLMIAFFSGIFVPRSFIHQVGQIVVSLATPIWQVKAVEKISELSTVTWQQTQDIWYIFAIQLLIALTYFALSYILQQGRLKRAKI